MQNSRFFFALVLAIANAAAVAFAAEPVSKTELEAPPPKPGPDGWYDAVPLDGSFKVRIPGTFQAFAEDGKTSAGAAARTSGVRANVEGAFGSTTQYITSCIAQEGDDRTAQQRLQGVIDRWSKLGLMRYRKNFELGSVPGFEFEIADDIKVMRARLLAPGRETCTILISWRPIAKPDDAQIEKYFESFAFTRR